MFGGYVRQSTAVTIPIGPFTDATDGFTLETALTLLQADFRLSKNGGAFAQKTEATTAAHMENGWYGMLLDATDTNTLGRLTVGVVDTGARQVWREYVVLLANVYDALVLGSDLLQVDVIQLVSDAQSATDLKDFADAGYDPATNKVQGVVAVDSTETIGSTGAAVVNAEVLDVLNVDTFAQPGQVAIPATASIRFMIAILYKWVRNVNRHNRTTGVFEVLNDDAATVDHKAAVSDTGGAGGVATRGEVAVGP